MAKRLHLVADAGRRHRDRDADTANGSSVYTEPLDACAARSLARRPRRRARTARVPARHARRRSRCPRHSPCCRPTASRWSSASRHATAVAAFGRRADRHGCAGKLGGNATAHTRPRCRSSRATRRRAHSTSGAATSKPAAITTGGAMSAELPQISPAARSNGPPCAAGRRSASREVDGWLWRHTSGGSIRANSVAALATPAPMSSRRSTRSRRSMPRTARRAVFTVSDVSVAGRSRRPPRLRVVTYKGEDHVTMAKPVAATAVRAGQPARPPPRLPRLPAGWTSTSRAFPPDRRIIAPRLIANLPKRMPSSSRT